MSFLAPIATLLALLLSPPASEPTPPRTPASEPAAYSIAHERVDSIGTEATMVTAIGDLQLGSGATLARATQALGEPDEQGPQADEPTVCEAVWDELGLTLLFYFGHPPSAEASCSKGPVAAAYMTDPSWTTTPGGLHVGSTVDEITRAHPRAREEPLSPGVAKQLGVERGWVLEDGAYGGDLQPVLLATVEEGRVAALAYLSIAD